MKKEPKRGDTTKDEIVAYLERLVSNEEGFYADFLNVGQLYSAGTCCSRIVMAKDIINDIKTGYYKLLP